ncbi:BREX system P-loop protein BrxC [Carnobacterium sp. PL17RED31]|nr:BREX system P-loop protein BrxC [Carnobacterium sp. PL17RED31]
MLIRDIFEKPIDRSIQTVVKVDQAEDYFVKKDLEEYVVTREINEHFDTFFENYRLSIDNPTDNVGAWISGFFGSGKSHFLKILSYLLENREVDGKYAIDYFIDDNKIERKKTIQNMKVAGSESTDVILFNIDSKNQSMSTDENNLTLVFLQVFNEMQGYDSNFYVADLERQLDKHNKYQEFQDKYKELSNFEWVDQRNSFHFTQHWVIETLVSINFMDENGARNYMERATKPYTISINDFAELVKDYINSKGDNHRVIFMVDEIGQYIGNNGKLMLNLQTIVEDLGTKCQGNAWVIVTSQQDISKLTSLVSRTGRGNEDFSKIQGRFETKLTLSSADVDEVIQKRILEKNKVAEQSLQVIYENNEVALQNMLVFSGTASHLTFNNKETFSEIYPFIPYQFNILGQVLTSIRTTSTSGTSVSDGERSLLGLFQSAAKKILDSKIGTFVPLNLFYDQIEKYLDDNHANVVKRAKRNLALNPEKEEQPFTVEVLKVLYLIKYVDNMESTVEDITTLMLSNIDEDRLDLQNKVNEALNILVNEMLVQKNQDTYIFLTNEEQEINRVIQQQEVSPSEITQDIHDMLYNKILPNSRKYKYPKENNLKFNNPKLAERFIFNINQNTDQRNPLKDTDDIGIHFITPLSPIGNDEFSISGLSMRNNEVVVVLPNDSAYVEEIRTRLKIRKFLGSNLIDSMAKSQEISDSKNREMVERNENAYIFLQESVKDATIYVNGNKVNGRGTDIINRIEASLEKLIDTLYFKLSYIDTPMTKLDSKKLLEQQANRTFVLDLEEDEPNKLAQDEVESFIIRSTSNTAKVSLKSIYNHFEDIPYGFIRDDIQWLVTRLFVKTKLSLSVNGETISTAEQDVETVLDYISNPRNFEKVLIEIRISASEQQKSKLRAISQALFSKADLGTSDDQMIARFKESAHTAVNSLRKQEIKSNQDKRYPDRLVITNGISLLESVINQKTPKNFFEYVLDHEVDLLDFADDYIDVATFYDDNSVQFDNFTEALKTLDLFHGSRKFVTNDKLLEVADNIQNIISMNRPYSRLQELPSLNQKFKIEYSILLDQESQPVKEKAENYQKELLDWISSKPYQNEYINDIDKSFGELIEVITNSNQIIDIISANTQADIIKERYYNKFSKEDTRLVELREKQRLAAEKEKTPNPDIVVKEPIDKAVNFKTVNKESKWVIRKEEDLDRYLTSIKRIIMNELDEDTTLHIRF